MGMSLHEQANTPIREINEILAVDDIYIEFQNDQQKAAKRDAESQRPRGKLGGGR